ncbi:MAG: ABC transporter permease [Frankiaceae bacterium]|nr:ABC transporter permease [Frankiaceae bacterium]MBV9369339.1 ABC transporter permease [Frankiales bacterium]
MRWNFVFVEMWQGLRRNLTMTVATILTITIALLFLGSAWLFHTQVNRTHDYWFGKIQISVFLKQSSTGPQQDAIQQELNALPQVKQVFFENRHDAWLRFKKEFSQTSPALVANSSESQMPQSYRVKLKNPRQFNIVAQAVKNLPGVDEVQAEPDALKRLFSFFDRLGQMVLVGAIIVLVAAVLLIFNNVRLAAYTRRREVGIMRLVGASDAYIQAPFVLEVAVCALIGGALAVGGLFMIKYFVFDRGIARAFNTNLLDIIGYGTVVRTIPYLVLTAILASVVTAVGTLQRYLRV